MKSYKITVDGQSYDVTVEELGAAAAGPAQAKPAAVAGARPAPVSPPGSAASAGAAPVVAGAAQVKAPMPGTLLSYKVAVGQAVKRGEVLLILEAMKMENEIVAPGDGVVKALCVAEGASVNTGDPLIELG